MKRYGTYKYMHPTYDGHGVRTYVAYSMHVEIVEEKGNRFRVRYLGQHANGAALNSLHWCRKDKVREDNPVIITEPQAPTFTDNIRLPYKDND